MRKVDTIPTCGALPNTTAVFKIIEIYNTTFCCDMHGKFCIWAIYIFSAQNETNVNFHNSVKIANVIYLRTFLLLKLFVAVYMYMYIYISKRVCCTKTIIISLMRNDRTLNILAISTYILWCKCKRFRGCELSLLLPCCIYKKIACNWFNSKEEYAIYDKY